MRGGQFRWLSPSKQRNFFHVVSLREDSFMKQLSIDNKYSPSFFGSRVVIFPAINRTNNAL